MALPSWPAGLPPIVGVLGTEGSVQLVTPPREEIFDDGAVRSRRETLTIVTPRSSTLPPLTKRQFEVFLAFLRDDLNGGARRFTAPIRQPDGMLGTRTCKFTGKVAEQDLGAWTRVSFTLLVFDW